MPSGTSIEAIDAITRAVEWRTRLLKKLKLKTLKTTVQTIVR